jgi:tetratricopeptide (TPR) repeat protein
MSILPAKKDRRILPRWRLSSKASHSSEYLSLKRRRQTVADIEQPLLQAADEFEKQPTIGMAADLISTALLAGKIEKSNSAVKFILEHESDTPHNLFNLAISISNKDSTTNVEHLLQLSIAQIRELLRLYPRNPVLWSDMARHYASIGNKQRASKCMQAALQLAPDHRWILRTSARFLVHQGDPIAAHKLLARHPRTRHDPWLIAAELACAQVAGRAPKYWKQAGDILKLNAVAPIHLSELAIAVAMMELETGERKKAKKCVTRGLISPTENTLAQVFWAKENRHLRDGFKLDELVRSAKDAYEADYQLNIANGELILALESAKTWSDDEPFAARPKSEIAYVASILDDYELAEKMTSEVERLGEDQDQTLALNKTFAMLSSGKLSREAHGDELDNLRDKLVSMVNENEDSYHALANLGLWHYRYGEIDAGRGYYQRAMQAAQKLHSLEASALAATFFAREAILSHDAAASSVLLAANELAKKAKNKASEFYLRKLDALMLNPSKAGEILTPKSAMKYIKVESRSPEFRIEKTSKGDVLWVPSINRK